MTSLKLVTGALVLASLAGCAPPLANKYEVYAVHHETVPGTVDGQWFVRDVRAKDGGVAAKELVYCPIVKTGPLVCRTSTVWEFDKTHLR